MDLTDAPIVAAALASFRDPAGRISPAFGLDYIRAALAALGDPQDAIPPAIHITGTNGKGSTGAFVRAMAEAAGLKVHAFTSPHLIRVNERIRVAGELVSDDHLASALNEVSARTDGLTYFEALTAAAFLLFARTPADLSIIEVGAGGATDATNVMARPAVTVVTAISLDHESLFGVEGVAAIAQLKSGIFRTGVPAVLTRQPPEAMSMLRQHADAIAAKLFVEDEGWRAGMRDGVFCYGGGFVLAAPCLSLPGAHQISNAGVACAALDALADPRITPEAMVVGLANARWPARLQKLQDGPLVSGFGSEIWVDAAHNPGGAHALSDAIRNARNGEQARIALIFACQAAKDAVSVLTALAPAVDMMFACPLPDSGGQEGGMAADPHALVGIARDLGVVAETAPVFTAAIAAAKERGATRIYLCGSLYLCGAALAANAETID
jgi:dihydrofolate synthase / folylpolyglutamate synthase